MQIGVVRLGENPGNEVGLVARGILLCLLNSIHTSLPFYNIIGVYIIQVLLHRCIYMYITMPLTAILSLHKYELLALNILHQNCWCKWSKSFDCYLKLIFSRSIDHFLHDRSTHVEKGCICDTHTEF